MRGRIVILLLLVLPLAALEPLNPAQAQFSPRGLLGAMTSPLRSMLGRFGHFPYGRRHHPSEQAAASQHGEQPARLGLVGPLAWPSAYEDVLGYTFWPNDYAGQFRGRGFDVIASSIGGQFNLGIARNKNAAQSATTGSSATETGPLGLCDERAEAQPDWPATRIEQTVQLSDPQRRALDQLRAAIADSIKTLKAGCHDTTSLPPTDRLKAMVQRIWAVRDAGVLVRAPLKTFYESLTDAQKANFDFKPLAAGHDDKAANAAMGRQVQACAAQTDEDSQRMMQQIEQRVEPKENQRSAQNALSKAVSDMAKLLSAACAQPIPKDPLARLDAANDRLSSMNFAATNVEIALNGFYSSLDQSQKAKLDSLGL
jgi:hypothetical protein